MHYPSTARVALVTPALGRAVLASVSANGASSKQPGAKPQVIHAKRYKG